MSSQRKLFGGRAQQRKWPTSSLFSQGPAGPCVKRTPKTGNTQTLAVPNRKPKRNKRDAWQKMPAQQREAALAKAAERKAKKAQAAANAARAARSMKPYIATSALSHAPTEVTLTNPLSRLTTPGK